MRQNALAIPVMTLLLVAAILLNIPVFRYTIVFAYLSFVPGFVILKTFKLKELGLLKTFLISVGLSLVASTFVGLLVNELYIILGLSQPLSIIPLTVAMSTFTLILFFISYRRDFSINFVSLDGMLKATRSYLPLTFALIILPMLSIVSASFVYIPIMVILCLTIAVLCVLSIASNKLIPSKSYPFLIFSISISILLINLLMSKYILGDDASLEYYVFKVTQIRGYWGPINAVTNSGVALTYNSMLSVTLLPNVYSVLMNLHDEMLFKILYSFIFSLVPITLYGIYRNETSKSIGLLSALFFAFGLTTFFGELISVNRQIVAEFFLMLSLLLWLDKTLPIKEKRILLIIFGVSVALSHYTLAILYLVFVSLVIVMSAIKSEFDDAFNAFTFLAIFGIAFLWYTFSSNSIITFIISIAQTVAAELTNFQRGTTAPGNRATIYGLPQVFTAASWINLVVSGLVTLSLLIGILAVILLSRRMEISDKYRFTTISAAIMLAISFLSPAFAATINFTRFYAIALLFLSPCLAIGALSFPKIIQSTLRKRNKNQKNNAVFLNRDWKTALLLVAVLLSAYFLSQIGFINYVTGGARDSRFEYYRMKTMRDPQVQVQFYYDYTPEQDVLSAVWLSKYVKASSIVYSDLISNIHVLTSIGLVPWYMKHPLTNDTKPEQGSYVYLDSLNVVKGIIPSTLVELFNTSEISSSLTECDLVYSNGDSVIWSGAGSS